METAKEQWRTIPGYNSYKVSNLGRVLSFRVHAWGVFLRGDPTRFGHIRVQLTDDVGGKSSPKMVHRLVALAFYGEPKPGYTLVRHLNGIPYDNRAENLRWGDAAENTADRLKHGGKQRKHIKRQNGLTSGDIGNIRRAAARPDVTIADVALKYNVHPRTVRHLTRNDIAICDFDTAYDIVCQYIEGMSQKDLSKKYGVSRPTISYIINRKGAYTKLQAPEVKRKHRVGRGGPKGITQAEAEEIRAAYSADRANTVTALGKKYHVSAPTINKIVPARGKWAFFGTEVKRPLAIPLEQAQQIHDQFHRDYPNLMDLVERYRTSFYTIKDIVSRAGDYVDLKPTEGPNRTSRLIGREQAEQIRREYRESPDNTLAVLAQRHHSSIGTINAILLAKGRYSYFGSRVARNDVRKPRVPIETAQEILDLYCRERVQKKYLKEKYGLAGGTITKILARDGCYSVLEPPTC